MESNDIMFDKQWVFDINQHNAYIAECNAKECAPSFVEEIMFKRGIEGKVGSLEDLSDPYSLPDMDKAIDRILTAIEDEECIAVFGDYDADGVTASAILFHFLQNIMAANVICYIPDRINEGYGMSCTAIDKLSEMGVSLIVTVDNGIVAFDEIQHAKELGIDVVVTDHHRCAEQLPDCCAVVNPCIIKEKTPVSHLCGAGVAYTLIRGLAETLGLSEEIFCYIPIVMIGTLGDIVPLDGDNRIIVKYGMEHFSDYSWPGIKSLMQIISEGRNTEPNISSTFISFQIVPKINAAGRLGNARRAFDLLISEDAQESMELAKELMSENEKRKETENEIAEKAISQEHLITMSDDAVVISVGEGWHHGVIGIVASKLVEKYGKPAFVFSLEDDIAKGSARSVDGFNIHEALTTCAAILERFGGHEMAAGLCVKKDNLRRLVDAMNKYAKEHPEALLKPPNIEIDAVAQPHEITIENVRRIIELEPFGTGNPEPLICVRNLKINYCHKVGDNGKHLKLSFSAESPKGDNLIIDAIAFSKGSFETMVKQINSTCSVICRLQINCWQGQERVSLIVSDIFDEDYNIDNIVKCVYNSRYITVGGFALERKMLAYMYKILLSCGEGFKFSEIYRVRGIMKNAGIKCSWYSIRAGLDIFTELGLILRKDRNNFIIQKNGQKVDLMNSVLYRGIQAGG